MHVMHTATHAHSDTLVWFGLWCRVVSECVDYHFHTCSGKVEGRFALISSSTLFRLCLGSAGDPFCIFLFLICPLYHFFVCVSACPHFILSIFIFLFRVYSLLNATSFSFYSIWSLPHFPASHWFCDISLFSTTASLRMFICFYNKLQRCTGNKGIGLMPNEWLQGWIWVKMLLQEWVFRPLEKNIIV